MAMPFIIHHDENIYSLDEKASAKMHKPPRYSSKYRAKILQESGLAKSVHKTMGYAEVPLAPPDRFLRRGGGIRPKRPAKDHQCYHKMLPPLPKQGGDKKKKEDGEDGGDAEGEADGQQAEGAPAAGGAAGREKPLKTIRIRPRYVDTNRGDAHDLKRSGLQPTYVYQANFGKLPKYLIKRIRDAAEQEEMFRDAQVRKQPLCRYVTQEERAELLGGLKHNWEEMQQVYQGLPVLTDTIPKGLRKTKLENDLKRLEQDILLVENLPYIYVYNSSEDSK